MAPEETLVWGAALALTLTIFVPYLVRFRRRNRRDRERKAEAVRLGIDRPTMQFPYIDPNRCVGCGACIEICPEGDVLGLVGGTAVVINGVRCVGHALCEDACPVGAIEVGVGDLKSRRDVPLLDDMETSLPGVFVAGELGGIALVRNATSQGRRVIERVADRLRERRPESGNGVLDLVIVGAGPAGLSASLAARERGLEYMTLEREESLGGSILHYPRRKMVLTGVVDLSPWGQLRNEEYLKEELLQTYQKLLDEAGLRVRFGEALERLERVDGHYRVDSGGGTYRAHCVVLAIGRRGSPRKLGVPGEQSPKVLYRLIDADSYSGKKILVVGGGDSAVEAAIGLAERTDCDVTLSYRKERLFRIKRKNELKISALFEERRIEPLFSSNLKTIRPDAVEIRLGSGDVITKPNDYVFVFAGGVPPYRFLQDLGIRFGGQSEPVGDG